MYIKISLLPKNLHVKITSLAFAAFACVCKKIPVVLYLRRRAVYCVHTICFPHFEIRGLRRRQIGAQFFHARQNYF